MRLARRGLGTPRTRRTGSRRRAIRGRNSTSTTCSAITPTRKWELGAVGCFYRQTIDDEIDGSDVESRKGRVFGIGPGERYNMDKLSLIGNAYFESPAEIRNEGTSAFFKFNYRFWRGGRLGRRLGADNHGAVAPVHAPG